MQSQDGPAILLTGTPAALQTGTPAAAPPPGPRQRVAVLVGLPGCGKSRLAVELEGMGWVRVNQVRARGVVTGGSGSGSGSDGPSHPTALLPTSFLPGHAGHTGRVRGSHGRRPQGRRQRRR